jgi:N-acetylglucosaminyl-diphospho-decaprenol L-rhamnosyltransferase|tara:strand:+ start:3561 stop:4436 length:876 start_codon:yes stop_codon:yes gene_type:complete
MNYKNITAIIVTFRSEKVIFDCLKSIENIKEIVIVDNSFDKKLKKKVLLKFPRINFILSSKNLGYGAGNNIALKKVKTRYALILNPDTILLKRCIVNFLTLAKNLKNKFSIIAPSVIGNVKNYGFFNGGKIKKQTMKKSTYFNVDYVLGFAMFLNIQKIKSIGYFDENFFMYLEEIDLCKRLKKINENIIVSSNASCKHLGARSSNIGFEFEINRNWHWMWSQTYFASKHNGFFASRFASIPELFKLIVKSLFYFIFFNRNKFFIVNARLSGLLASFFKLKSYFRPKLDAR